MNAKQLGAPSDAVAPQTAVGAAMGGIGTHPS